jgi:tRNA-intron endonuclease
LNKCSVAIFEKKDDKCVFVCDETSRELDPYETIYEFKKNKLVVKDSDGNVYSGWFEALKHFSTCEPRAWIMFSVYYDLRERGRMLKTGPLPNSFTMYKGPKPESLIIVLEETVKFKVEEIFRWIETAKRMNRDCILAIVDKHGDVSYYQLEMAGVGELSLLT